MEPLSARQLMQVWDAGQDQRDLERSVTLLVAACPEMDRDQLWELPIGQRDAKLLALRESTLGPGLEVYAECDRCGTAVEVQLDAADLRSPSQPPDKPLEIRLGRRWVRFRLPTSTDLLELGQSLSVDEARATLLRRCVLAAGCGRHSLEPEDFTAQMLGALDAAMGEHDPQAEILLNLSCPECGHRWQSLFDIGGFFWTELDAIVRQLVRQVHILACAYGWRESDILALSAGRRQLYLEMLGE
jgi:hypothetical protein